MSTQSAFTLLVPGSPQKPLPFVLKKIMDNLPPNIMADGADELEKEKLISTGDGQSCGDGGGSGGSGVSASLTPAIWDKTIPYDGENFHLEYMDLEEFLLENQIPAALEEELHKSLDQETMSDPPPAIQDSAEEKQEVEALEKEDVEVVGCGGDVEGMVALEHDSEPKVKQERRTPSPVRAEEIEVNVNFQPDLTDLVLSSVPGGELFNPRKHRFSEEELKPQPIIKKARKVFVPEDAKDEKYWSRRKKNNVAAKRSRDARRLKENQIAVRAGFLERENAALRKEVAELRKSCNQCKKVMALYEAKYGPV